MNRVKLTLLAAISIALAFTLSCSGDNNPLSGNKQFCDGNEYNSATEFCHANTIYAKCSDKEYNPDGYVCTDGKVVPKGEDNKPGGNSSSSGGSNNGGVSSSSGSDDGDLWCDYGPESTYRDATGKWMLGGGCYSIGTAADCDTRYGKITNKCGETGITVCDYGVITPNAYEDENGVWQTGGGCHQMANANDCTIFGEVKTECPKTSLNIDDGNNVVPSSSSGNNVGMGGSLWGTDTEKFAALQVQTPAVLACKQREGENYWSSACLDAGWWFGYTFPEDRAQVEVEINGAYTDGTAEFQLAPDGESLISNAFKIKFAADAAELHESGEYMNTNGAGVGFNFKVNEKEAENITSKGGFCVSYTSTAEVLLEIESNVVTDHNTWIAVLPASANKRVANLPWNSFVSSWSPPSVTLANATAEATGIRIVLKNNTTSPRSADFALMQLGWAGECN